MNEKIEKLNNIANQLEVKAITDLHAVADETEQIYRKNPTLQNGKNRDYAQKSLEEKIRQLWEKYFPVEKTFKNRFEVLKHLKAKGYKISRGKFYKDCPKNGSRLISVNQDGTVPVSEVDKYIVKAELEKKSGGESDEDFRRKAKAEADHKETHVLISRLKYEELKGDLVAKAEVTTLLVDRIREFRQALLSQGRRLGLRCAHKPAEQIQDIIDGDNRAILEAYARDNPITGPIKVPEDLSSD